MSRLAPAAPSRQAVTLTMRALHRIDGTLPFQRVPLRNAVPVLSLTFDDIPDSAAQVGAPMLEAAGVRGTFFVATGLIGRRGEHWRHADAPAIVALAARGHEIGLHSSGHRPAGHLGPRAFADDMAQSRAALREFLPGTVVDNYAFPYGFANALHRRCLGRATRSCRTTHPGLNLGTADPRRLLSHPLGERRRDDAHVDRLLDEAAAKCGWLILTLHDVGPAPSPYGCTAGTLSRVVEGARARGMAIRPVSEALDLCGLPARAAA